MNYLLCKINNQTSTLTTSTTTTLEGVHSEVMLQEVEEEEDIKVELVKLVALVLIVNSLEVTLDPTLVVQLLVNMVVEEEEEVLGDL